MESKIVNIHDIEKVSRKLQNENKRVVLAGGCFDLLHIGHITFLEEAKKQGDSLVVLLESDDSITTNKGPKRPINGQLDRAKILAALCAIDYVILLNSKMSNKDYDNLAFMLKPAIIATTSGDSKRDHKERQAELVNAKVLDVTMPISDKSTTALIRLLDEL